MAKRVAEALGRWSGATAIARRMNAGAVAVLAYHNVVPPDLVGRGDASLHIDLPTFLAQVERLARTHDIVHLDSVARTRPGGRPRAVLTFDDAYRGAVTFAFPELRRRGIPATVFVSPGLLGEASTWWDELGERGELSSPRRTRALTRHHGVAAAVRAEFGDEPVQLPASYGIATLEELEEQCGADIAVGSHSWGHEHLPTLPGPAMKLSLERAHAWVRSFNGRPSAWLALPYGAGDPRVSTTALSLGHEGVLRVAGGLWRPHHPAGHVPRLNVPAGLSASGLELRTSGLLSTR